jgi:hypothetical protein
MCSQTRALWRESGTVWSPQRLRVAEQMVFGEKPRREVQRPLTQIVENYSILLRVRDIHQERSRLPQADELGIRFGVFHEGEDGIHLVHWTHPTQLPPQRVGSRQSSF